MIEYLGRYTHKVAISNQRLVEVDQQQVSFRYKDYRQNGATKIMALPVAVFVRRFALHILPRRFIRIRHYGILSSRWKNNRLQKLREVLKMQPVECKPLTLIRKCPCCKTGILITIEVFEKRGPPPTGFMVAKNVPVPQP